MSIYALKPKFQNLLRPLVQRLYKLGITANQVTLIACVISVFLGAWLTWLVYGHDTTAVNSYFLLIPLWFLVRMAFNAIDGMLAREFGQKSHLGGYLNELTDVISDAFLYLPFAFITPFAPWQIALVIWLATLTEFVGVLGQAVLHDTDNRRYDGPMGKSDRALVFSIIAGVYVMFGLASWWYWAVWGVIVLLIITCIKRLKNGLKISNKP